MEEPVAVGKPSTPTPNGQFFAVELLNAGNPGGAYGPYAFTLSGYSNVYQTFGSGDGAVGMHGTNEYSSVGNDASHGCVRLHNDAITRLAGHAAARHARLYSLVRAELDRRSTGRRRRHRVPPRHRRP